MPHSKSVSFVQPETSKLFLAHLRGVAQNTELHDVTFSFNGDQNEETSVKANRGLLSVLSPVFRYFMSKLIFKLKLMQING